ncbi:phage shock protein A [Rhodoblastus sphagnicola]|nr:PspA/IM30 family protein [Rhodoblastus sphagnicola]MBB4198314.1 phage shock protein A [Rhodoblastus sphagnicola]
MFKTLVKLFRAKTFITQEQFSDAHALTLLDQQIRDCVAALAEAKKAAALATAQHQGEQRRLAMLEAEIADLEIRACAALNQDRDDLALETAGLLADLEADRNAVSCACALYEGQCARMRRRLRKSEARLSELHRGRNLVRAKNALGQLRRDAQGDNPFRAGFAEVEATLARLTERNLLAEDVEEARAGLDDDRNPQKMAEKLSEAGRGPRLRATAEDVFARLRAKTAA